MIFLETSSIIITEAIIQNIVELKRTVNNEIIRIALKTEVQRNDHLSHAFVPGELRQNINGTKSQCINKWLTLVVPISIMKITKHKSFSQFFPTNDITPKKTIIKYDEIIIIFFCTNVILREN